MSMNPKDILVTITNHNFNENSMELKRGFSGFFDTITIDSGSDNNDDFDIKLGNVYYSGLFNESVRLSIDSGKKYLFFINSDVYIDNYRDIYEFVSSLADDVFLYSPSSRGQSANHCKNKKTNGLRDVTYVEGFTFLANLEILDFYPVSVDDNKLGYGLDIVAGLRCKELGKRCVIDDRVEVYHREGTGYNTNRATAEMYNWLNKINKTDALGLFYK